MSNLFAKPVWPACHSSMQLDRLAMDELPEGEAAALRAHVETCPSCAALLAEIRAVKAETLPPLRAPTTDRLYTNDSQLIAPRRFRRVAFAASALAAAAVFFLIASPRDAERSKGAREFSLGLYVQHGEEVRRAGPGEIVHPGDALRFSTTAKESGFAAVLSLDSQGLASIYFPAGKQSAPSAAGVDVPLPLSTRLDATLGAEQLFGLWCKDEIDLEPVRQSLARGALQLPAGCQLSQLQIEKR